MMVSELRAEYRRQADTLCAGDPVQASVRDELLDLYKHLGSDFGPNSQEAWIYQVIVHPATNRVDSMPMNVLTRVVDHFIAMFNGNLPMVLDMVSLLLADPTVSPIPVTEEVLASIRGALHEYNLVDGWEFYGMGVCSGATAVNEDAPKADEFAKAGRVHEHPDAHPVWYTKLVTRDARVWTLIAEQGEEIFYVTTGPDEVESEQGEFPMGTALTRLVTSIATT